MKGMMYLNACELTASVTAAANAIACRLSTDELSLLSAVLVQLQRQLVRKFMSIPHMI